jgi:RNA-directed DNA polymerase
VCASSVEQLLGARIVTYADDLVILCHRGRAAEALTRMRELMRKLKLTVNEEKTRICSLPDGHFDFLGYTFGRLYAPRIGSSYIGYRPSKRSIRRAVDTHLAWTLRRQYGEIAQHASRKNG